MAFDFDGTLAPIVPRPEDARLDPHLTPLLSRLAPAVAAVAVISGRDRKFLADRVSGVLTLGSYGLELPGELSPTGLPPGFPAAEVRRRLGAAREELVSRIATLPGTHLEVKAWGLALHYRGADAGLDHAQAAGLAEEVARSHGLKIQPGRLVVELKPHEAVDKGWALRRLVSSLDPSAVIFCGDDQGDQPAWEVARDLNAPGLAVGIRSSELPAGALDGCNLVLEGREELRPFVEALTEAATTRAPSA